MNKREHAKRDTKARKRAVVDRSFIFMNDSNARCPLPEFKGMITEGVLGALWSYIDALSTAERVSFLQ